MILPHIEPVDAAYTSMNDYVAQRLSDRIVAPADKQRVARIRRYLSSKLTDGEWSSSSSQGISPAMTLDLSAMSASNSFWVMALPQV